MRQSRHKILIISFSRIFFYSIKLHLIHRCVVNLAKHICAINISCWNVDNPSSNYHVATTVKLTIQKANRANKIFSWSIFSVLHFDVVVVVVALIFACVSPATHQNAEEGRKKMAENRLLLLLAFACRRSFSVFHFIHSVRYNMRSCLFNTNLFFFSFSVHRINAFMYVVGRIRCAEKYTES